MKRLFCGLFFVGVFTSSIFSIVPSLNNLSLSKNESVNAKLEGLSSRLERLLSDYKNDGDQQKVLSRLDSTKNNILSSVQDEHERKGLQELNKHLINHSNVIPVNLEIQKTNFSDKIYNLTLRLLSPSAIFAVAGVIIIKSIEKMILSGEVLRMIESGTNFYFWQTIGSIAPAFFYYLPWLIKPFCGV